MGKSGSNIVTRTVSGIVLLAVVAGATLLSQFTFLLLAMAIGLGCLWEFYRLAGHTGAEPLEWYCMLLGALIIATGFLAGGGFADYRIFAIPISFVLAVFIAELYRKKSKPVLNISVSIGGLAYAALPMAMLCLLAFATGSYNPYLVLTVIFTVWVNDIFAYLTGIAFGRHKLFERISPKKSWEGFFGGLVFAVAFAVLCGYLSGGNMLMWGIMGMVIVLGAVFGDLVESLIKRSANAKDSGRLIPGHGGMLDRFDALLFAVPLVYVYFLIFIA